jgi:hypothetical protein
VTINIGGANSSWLTSLSGIVGGIGIALLGAVTANLIMATNTEKIIFIAMAALGNAGTGLAAKQFNVHSTNVQVAQATAKADAAAPKP